MGSRSIGGANASNGGSGSPASNGNPATSGSRPSPDGGHPEPRQPVRRDAVDQRQASEVHYRRLFETAPDGILVVDAESGRILDVNPSLANLLGITHDECVGKEPWEVGLMNTGEQLTATERPDIGHLDHGDVVLHSLSHAGGINVDVTSTNYRDGDHPVVQWLVRDVSVERTAALAAAQHAETLATAGRHKDEFLAVLSHELRNALAPIANALLILRLSQEAESPVPNRARSIIENQVGHLSRLVGDLQEISLIEAGRMRFWPVRADICRIVQRSVDAVLSSHADGRHEVSLSLPDTSIWLDADIVRMEQVVVNLVSNAVKYTLDGGRITISVNVVRDRVELRVADRGVGIAPEALPHVFDLFVQPGDLQARSRGGLGIGLHVVQRIVEAHGGTVVARSDGLGAGSEFVVSLPLASPLPAREGAAQR